MKLKKGLPIVITIAMVLTMGVGSSYAETSLLAATSTETEKTASDAVFTDISGHWAESIIKEAATLKIVGGYPDGTFLPDNLIKREEFYKLLSNILTEKPDTTNTKIQFTDVVDDEWYVPTIKIAVASGITSGYEDGTFGIGLMISRQEAAKVAGSVISSYGVEDEKGAETALDKSQIADWAYKYVDLMFKKGYMKGDTEGNFRPTTALTRAEAATILLNIKKNESVIAASADELSNTNCAIEHKGQEGIFLKGDGTKSDPYQIAKEEQLNHVRMHVSEGAFYILTKNIAITKDYATNVPKDWDDPNWSEGNFEPIGSKEIPFTGSLDGNGYTITGLNITGSQGHGDNIRVASYAGLFGYLAKGSSVADLTIDASTIEGYQYVGAVAGYSEGSVKNCQLGSKGIINGDTYTGGFVGYSNYPLSSLRNMGEVTGKNLNTGGIVGYICAPGTALLNCRNEGTVTGQEKSGGIAGTFTSSLNAESVMKECSNKGTVEGGTYQAGGIAGYAGAGVYSVTIESCENSEEVTGTGVNGGIVGWLDKGKSIITLCKNTGTVEGSNSGGIAGKNQGEISNSYNSGIVSAEADGGGIAAYQTEGQITKCYNEGKIAANSNSGGIIGKNGSTVSYSYNSGKVHGSGVSGGIAGKNEGTIKYVYGSGAVTGETSSGSLIGRNSGTLNTAFWLDISDSLGVGLTDSSSNQTIVMKVTQEQLSGQKKIQTQNGYEMLINILNEKDAAWKYLYKILIPAPGNTTVVSDGGSVVTPLEIPSTDSTGNTIEPTDLNSKYLYPALIN